MQNQPDLLQKCTTCLASIAKAFRVVDPFFFPWRKAVSLSLLTGTQAENRGIYRVVLTVGVFCSLCDKDELFRWGTTSEVFTHYKSGFN